MIKHTAKVDAKARGETPATVKMDQSLSKLKVDQVASMDKRVSIHVNFSVPQDNLTRSSTRELMVYLQPDDGWAKK